MRIKIALWIQEMHPTLDSNMSCNFIQTLLCFDLNRFYVSLKTTYHPWSWIPISFHFHHLIQTINLNIQYFHSNSISFLIRIGLRSYQKLPIFNDLGLQQYLSQEEVESCINLSFNYSHSNISHHVNVNTKKEINISISFNLITFFFLQR